MPTVKKKNSGKDKLLKGETLAYVATQMKFPEMSFWIPLTSKRNGNKVFIPLPIHLIQQISEEKGGGCVVRSKYGDEILVTENICEIFRVLNGTPIGKGAACWELAG